MLGNFRGNLRRNVSLAGMDPADCIDQLVAKHSFDEIAHSANFNGAGGLDIARIRCEDHNAGVGKLSPYRCGCIDSIHLGHAQVHEGYIGPVLPEGNHCVDSVICLAYQFHIGLLLERECYAIPHQRMIVNAKNLDSIRNCHEFHPNAYLNFAPGGLRLNRAKRGLRHWSVTVDDDTTPRLPGLDPKGWHGINPIWQIRDA
jgi:hypothetical protein